MMKTIFKRHLLLLILILLQLSACKKSNETHIVKGIIYKDCALAPFANEEIQLYHHRPPYSKGQVATTTTNANGEFELKYNSLNTNLGDFRLQYEFGFGFTTLMTYLPIDQDLNLNIIQNNTATLIVKLDIGAPLTVNDTLYYVRVSIDPPPFLSIIGPTHDTILNTFQTNGQYLGLNGNPSYNGTRGGYIYWGIGWNSINKTIQENPGATNTPHPNSIKYTLHGCGVQDEVTIKVN